MKLLVTGSRNITNFDISAFIPQNTELIISGGAKGIDEIAEKYADKMKISKLIIRPQYFKYKRNAPLKRNEIMVDICDEVLAFWDGISTGTKHTISYAKKKNKPVEVIIMENNK